MTPQKYQRKVREFDCHPEEGRREAHLLGLYEEIGEFCGKLCKAHRKGVEPKTHDLVLEGGDIIWRYVAILSCDNKRFETYIDWMSAGSTSASVSQIIDELMLYIMLSSNDSRYKFARAIGCLLNRFDLNLDQVLDSNIRKLEGRKERDTIIGEGDHR